MREIKFRAWDLCEKKMLSPNQYWLEFYYDNPPIMFDNISENGQLPPRRTIELMQYIGLKDKNGKEVFESDIIKWPAGLIEVVEWQQFYGGNFIGPGWQPFCEMEFPSDFEVIGNFYETPELLK